MHGAMIPYRTEADWGGYVDATEGALFEFVYACFSCTGRSIR